MVRYGVEKGIMTKLSIQVDSVRFQTALRKSPSSMLSALRKAIKTGATMIQLEAAIVHRYMSRSGMLGRSVRTKAKGAGAEVYLDTGIAKYGPFIHEGWKRPKNKSGWSWKPDKFLDAALKKKEDDVETEISKAIDVALTSVGL